MEIINLQTRELIADMHDESLNGVLVMKVHSKDAGGNPLDYEVVPYWAEEKPAEQA